MIFRFLIAKPLLKIFDLKLCDPKRDFTRNKYGDQKKKKDLISREGGDLGQLEVALFPFK